LLNEGFGLLEAQKLKDPKHWFFTVSFGDVNENRALGDSIESRDILSPTGKSQI
jgi:hypothetical protein